MSIYFLKAGDFVAYKIGFTTGDPLRRMADLQVGCPFRLELLGCIEGTTEDEQELHKLLQDFRTTGEWFEPHTVVTDAISRAIKNGIQIKPFRPRRQKHQNSICEIIDLLGGNIRVATLTGNTPKNVSNWRKYGQFPSNTFFAIRRAMTERGLADYPDSLWGMKFPESAA